MDLKPMKMEIYEVEYLEGWMAGVQNLPYREMTELLDSGMTHGQMYQKLVKYIRQGVDYYDPGTISHRHFIRVCRAILGDFSGN